MSGFVHDYYQSPEMIRGMDHAISVYKWQKLLRTFKTVDEVPADDQEFYNHFQPSKQS